MIKFSPLGWVVEVHEVLRGDGHAITHGGAKVPSLQDRQDLLLDAVADALKQFGFHNIALSVDCDLDDYVPFDASRQVGARHRRIGENLRQCRHNLIAGEWRTRHSTQGEPPRAVCSGAFCCIGWSVGEVFFWVLAGFGTVTGDARSKGRDSSVEESVRSGPTGARYTIETEPDEPGIPWSTSDGTTKTGAARCTTTSKTAQ